jgi:hypothetical protein
MSYLIVKWNRSQQALFFCLNAPFGPTHLHLFHWLLPELRLATA